MIQMQGSFSKCETRCVVNAYAQLPSSAASIRFNDGGCRCAHSAELAFCFSPMLRGEPIRGTGSRAFAASISVYRLVVAVEPSVVSVIWIVRAIEAVVVIAAASEAVPSAANAAVADVRDATCAQAADAAGAKATHATAEAAHVTSAKATAHMASAKAAATPMATTASATAAGLGTSSQQASGEHCARQNHHHSSSHDILLWDGRTVRHRSSQTPACSRKANANVVLE